MRLKGATRDRLLEAAEEVFASKGYYETVVDEIARQSNTSKGTVYFHFPSKERLFLAVVDHLANRLIRRVERSIEVATDPRAQVEAALATTMDTLARHKTLASLLLSKGFGMGTPFVQKRQEIFARFAEQIKTRLDEALPTNLISTIDTHIVAYAWLGAVSEVVVKWLNTGEPHPVREALPTLRTVLLRGVGLGPVGEQCIRTGGLSDT